MFFFYYDDFFFTFFSLTLKYVVSVVDGVSPVEMRSPLNCWMEVMAALKTRHRQRNRSDIKSPEPSPEDNLSPQSPVLSPLSSALCPQSRVNDFSPSQSTCRQLIEVTSHLIGVCGGMMTPSSSGRFFFGVLSTCSLRERERESHLHILTAGQSTITTFRSRLYISTFGSRTVGSSSKNSRPSMSLLLR